MIIEFMGLPGVGKSYLGKQIEQELSLKQVRCISVVEKSRSSIGWKILSKCFHILIPAMPEYRQQRTELADMVKSYTGRFPMYNDSSVRIIDYIEQVVFLNCIYKRLQKSKSLYIFDEGVSQQFANMIVNFGVDVKSIQRMLSLLEKIPQTVYLTYPIEQIKEAIASRNRHVCYIDELSGEELDRFLITYQEACNMISRIVNPLIIDRSDDKQLNLEKVVRATIG